MHARLTTRQIEPDRIDEAIGIYRDTVVPVLSQQLGSKGGLVMTDRGTGKVMSSPVNKGGMAYVNRLLPR